MAKKSLLISSHPQKILGKFSYKKNLGIENFKDLQISFDHPHYLKSQVPPWAGQKVFLINQQLCLLDAETLVQLFCLCSFYHGHHHHCHHHYHHHPGSNFRQNRHEQEKIVQNRGSHCYLSHELYT